MSIHDAAATAKITAKGQITIPVEVRRLLGLSEGDSVMFRVIKNGDRQASVSKVTSWRELAGSVPTPPEWEGASWQEMREHARKAAAERTMRASS